MAIFLLSNNPQLTIQTAITLKSNGLDCQPFESASELSAASRVLLPEAVLVDLSSQRRERIRLLGELRRRYPAAQIPLVVFHPVGVERSIAMFKQLNIDLEYNLQSIPPTFSLTLKNLVHRLVDRPAGQAHPYALETLARVWRQGLSGHLMLGRQKVVLCEGGLVNTNHLNILERGLMQGGFRFSAVSVNALGDWYSVATVLWNAARTRTTEGFYSRHQRMVFKARPNSSRAESLPLSDATRQLLSDRRKELSLRRHLSVLKLRSKVVEQDLEVLYLLGLYRFVSARTRTGRSHDHLKGLPPPSTTRSVVNGSSTRSNYSDLIDRKPIDARLKTRLMLKRLRREVETLSSANEWTVLGIEPTADSSLIDLAGDRMRTRYRDMSVSASNSEARELAEKLRIRADEAHIFLSVLAAVYQIYGAPADPHCREEIAFHKGLAMLQREEVSMSMRLFSAACYERMQSPRNLAYLGWTTFLHQGATAHAEALELLHLSESLDNKASTTQFFLAGIEHGIGENERAEERLSRLIRRGNAPESVHTLYRKVRRKLR